MTTTTSTILKAPVTTDIGVSSSPTAASKDDSPVLDRTGSSSPSSSPTTTSPLTESISKKLKVLLKREAKLIKYSQDPLESLSQDQRDALSRLPSVQASIKELSEVLPSIAAMAASHDEVTAGLRADLAQAQSEVTQALTQVEQAQTSFQAFLQLLHTLQYDLKTVTTLPPPVLSGLLQLKAALFIPPSLAPASSNPSSDSLGCEVAKEQESAYITSVSAIFESFKNAAGTSGGTSSTGETFGDIEFSALAGACEVIRNPPPKLDFLVAPTTSVVVEEEEEVEVNAVLEAPVDVPSAAFVEEENAQAEVEIPTHQRPLTSISFFNPSELNNNKINAAVAENSYFPSTASPIPISSLLNTHVPTLVSDSVRPPPPSLQATSVELSSATLIDESEVAPIIKKVPGPKKFTSTTPTTTPTVGGGEEKKKKKRVWKSNKDFAKAQAAGKAEGGNVPSPNLAQIPKKTAGPPSQRRVAVVSGGEVAK